MKEFVIYTGLRLLLYIACFLLVFAVWQMLAPDSEFVVIGSLGVALLLSGVASYFVLNRQREAFAQRIDARAQRATAKFDEMRAKEDE